MADFKKIKLWKGEQDREMKFYLPCSCGCDFRGMTQKQIDKYVGYISGSDANGNGVTVWITQKEYEAIK